MTEKILILEDLKTSFFTKKGEVRAVDGVSFSVKKGEIVGLVGESGCGKSVTSLSIMGLVPQPAGKVIAGKIIFKNENLLDKNEDEMRRLRGDRLSMILQDPMVSMNQLLTVGYQLGEPFKYHKKVSGSLKDMCIRLLEKVKVPSPELRIHDYPFQFSGGMSQRALIAMGIANNPDLLLADEPTTALDVTIQAQILQLMKDIQRESGSSIILITHDLASIAQICTRVLVMYAGRIVEKAPIKEFYKNPVHPYSVGLIKSVPVLGRRKERLFSIHGQPPNLLNPPKGCRFLPRCTKVMDICATKYPPETFLKEGHSVSCWLFSEGKK
ncbi:MAG: ABC transporter ATP-binding protein [Desulfobacterales bacterium]|nr:ABC transporter ATP-binding protein [Desulfobacterales bacterium]